LVLALAISARAQQTTFAGNAQHTAQFEAAAQPLNAVHWTVPVDLVNTGAWAHYASPLITPANTVLVSVRTAAGFQVSGYEGATGRLKYTLTNDYRLPTPPTNSWVPVYQPVIAHPPSAPRLYYAGAGGTMFYITNLDSDTPSGPVQQSFYTNLAGYKSNAVAFNSTIFINTPLTANSNGVIFFGFRVQQTAPPPLDTTQSGFARVDPDGTAVYVLAGAAANDPGISRDSHNCAPALSNDGSTLYVAAKGPSTAYYAYLLGLDSVTLATKYRVLLKDPVNGNLAGVYDDGTASPTIGPDGDVYFGVMGDPNNGRGYLLHFSADLLTKKTPAGFGWDYTPVIVPADMVPGYNGSSSYLLFSKYNNYANFGGGDGINRIALLDPNAVQVDPHPSTLGLMEMREVLTVMGATPDEEHYGVVFPYAVREWCINTGAVNPATKSIFAPSEDGHIYRWNVATHSITETLSLGPQIGSPYVPTAIGPDGAVYTIHGGYLFSLGGLTNLSLAIYSSAPDVRSVVVGQPVTFTAIVSNTIAAGPVPTGTVTFEDVTYDGLDPITNILALNVPLTNGIAVLTNSTLSAGTNHLGNHFVTAIYSGDSLFAQGRSTLVQKIHARTSLTTLVSALSTNATDDTVVFTAAVNSIPSANVAPSGMVAFWDGTNFLGQTGLDTNGTCILLKSGLSGSSHAIAATYSSDTMTASSSASMVGTPAYLQSLMASGSGSWQLRFSNVIGAPFTVLRSLELSAAETNWEPAGSAIEIFPGQFQFVDDAATNGGQKFYRVRSP